MIESSQLEEAARRLAERFHPDKIILFGSQARGTADERSDADFLVIMPLPAKRRALATEMDWALRGMDFDRDIILLTPGEYDADRGIPGTVARMASIEGRIMYERAS